MGCILTVDGGTDQNVNARLAFDQHLELLKTKLHIFDSNVKSVFLYGFEKLKDLTSKLQWVY
jgi:hypothetical protein